jgi:putative two-component system response regulator
MNKISNYLDIKKISYLTFKEKAKILVIESHIFSRMTTVDLLSSEGYDVYETDGNTDILEQILTIDPDLILLDLRISQVDSFQICEQLKHNPETYLIPVIFTSVSDDNSLRLQCFQVGGDDILTKPLDRMLVKTRVKSLIRQKKLNENLDQTEQVLFAIARAIESRYSPNQKTSLKLVELVQEFGVFLNLTPLEIDNLICAAYLHDIGTIFIPDAIILKQEKLTASEQETLKQHVLLGEEICQPLKNKQEVIAIIRHHHERQDGSGYPDGLIGEQIPPLAQIFQILDIYYALTSERHHKKALTSQQALDILREETLKGWRNNYLVEQFITFIANYEKSKN